MTDYVVTRRRKRYAVDPCLGYYMYAPLNDAGGPGESVAPVMVSERIGPGLELDRTESAPHPMKASHKSGDKTTRGRVDRSSQDGQRNQPRLQEENALTVDAFLKGKTAKTYRYRKLSKHQDIDHKHNIRTKRVNRRESALHRSSSSNDKSSGSHRRPDSKNTRRRKNRRPLKDRLYEAAVLTHGNPDDYYTRSEADTASNRVALLFVPEHASQDRHATHTKAMLVDPQKSMAMQTASSFAWRPLRDSGLLSNTLDRIPLSRWNLTSNGGRQPKLVTTVPTSRKETKSTGDTAFMASDCPPLRFVSFQEAEKDYKVMFPGAA